MVKLKKPTFAVGQPVLDEHGIQCEIIASWGGFYCCSECGEIATPKVQTKCCKAKPIAVGAEGVFDVKYASGLRKAWHQDWLSPIKVPVAV
jgi:hypothetical protein